MISFILVNEIHVVGTWQAILKDIGKGKLISSGAFYNSSKEKIVRDNENETGNRIFIYVSFCLVVLIFLISDRDFFLQVLATQF